MQSESNVIQLSDPHVPAALQEVMQHFFQYAGRQEADHIARVRRLVRAAVMMLVVSLAISAAGVTTLYLIYQRLPELTHVQYGLIEVDKTLGQVREIKMLTEPYKINTAVRNNLLADVLRQLEQYDSDLNRYWANNVYWFVTDEVFEPYFARLKQRMDEKQQRTTLIEITVPPVEITTHANDGAKNTSVIEYNQIARSADGSEEVFAKKAYLTYRFVPYKKLAPGETYTEMQRLKMLKNPFGLVVSRFSVENIFTQHTKEVTQ